MQPLSLRPLHAHWGPTILPAHLYPHTDFLQLDVIELLREAPHRLVTAGADLLHDGRDLARVSVRRLLGTYRAEDAWTREMSAQRLLRVTHRG